MLMMISIMLALHLLVAIPARADVAVESTAETVWVGIRDVVIIRGPSGGIAAEERARIANLRIEELLGDPACGPEGWKVSARDSLHEIRLCGREILVVGQADTLGETGSVSQVAVRWKERLQSAYAAEKASLYSKKLLWRAIVGLLLPLGFIAAILLVRLAARRLRLRLLSVQRIGGGIRMGPVRLMSGAAERRITARIVLLMQWLSIIVMTYIFAVLLFEQFPATAAWGRGMASPFAGLLIRTRVLIEAIAPRLLLAGVIIGFTRLVHDLLGRLFVQVRSGQVRMEPFLSVETAGPAEMTAKILITALAVMAIVLLVPGEAGQVLLVALGLAGLALALGAQDGMASAVAGFVLVYARPIRTGQRIRTRGVEGLVKRKGLLHVRILLDDGRITLVPNRWFLRGATEVLGGDRRVILSIQIQSTAGDGVPPSIDAAMGLVRHAAAIAGLKRDEGEIEVMGLEEGRIRIAASWRVDAGDAPMVRSAWIAALLEKAPGMHMRIVSVGSLRSIHR